MAHRWHRDPEVDKALIRLIDALCTWERNTGRGSTLLYVPVDEDEDPILAIDGKPLDEPFVIRQLLERLTKRFA